MKRLVLLAAAFMAATFGLKAQRTFEKNDIILNVGVGIGTAVDVGKTVVPPIFFQGEYCVADRLFDNFSSIGVGAYFGFAAGKNEYFNFGNVYAKQKINSLLLGVRGVFHYEFVRNLDTYAGIMMGANIANTRNEGNWGVGGVNTQPNTYGGFLFDFFFGARYYFTPVVGVFGEFGFGVAYFNLGVTFKI